MFERVYNMLIKEFIQIFRDPRMKLILFIAPLVQTMVFGYALTTDVNTITTAIYDLDNSYLSRKLVAALGESGYFEIREYPTDYHQVTSLLDEGVVEAVVHIDTEFQQDILGNKTGNVQVLIDGSDANTASIINTYTMRVLDRFSNEISAKRIEAITHTTEAAGVDLRSRAWFNQNLESRNFYIPGVVATLLTLITLTLTSMAIVREKEIGTMEQILVTPITPKEFILGKTIPFIILGFVNVFAILLVAVFWFEVMITGNIFLLLFAASLYLLTTLGIGLLISTISQTQQQAMMSAFLCYFPITLLSGFIFPINNMPVFIQWLTYLNPLKYFLIIIRGVFLKGIGFNILWPQIACLAVMGFSILWFASKKFRKTMS